MYSFDRMAALNRAEFDALVSLLRLRREVVEHEASQDADDEDLDIEQVSLQNQAFLDGCGTRTDVMTEKFLDRLAELVSRRKGGRHVRCAVLREHEDLMHVSVSGNTDSDQADKAFFKNFEDCMRDLAARAADYGTFAQIVSLRFCALLMECQSCMTLPTRNQRICYGST